MEIDCDLGVGISPRRVGAAPTGPKLAASGEFETTTRSKFGSVEETYDSVRIAQLREGFGSTHSSVERSRAEVSQELTSSTQSQAYISGREASTNSSNKSDRYDDEFGCDVDLLLSESGDEQFLNNMSGYTFAGGHEWKH